MNTAYISIGSNIDKEINLPAVFHRLHKQFQVGAVSSVYATAPVGPSGQHAYWNAAVEIRTALSYAELSKQLKQWEAEFGRERDAANKYTPRPLDLDVVLFNELVISDGRIVLPSPQLEKFAFVLMPMAEIAPQLVHPRLGLKLAAMAADFHDDTQSWDRIDQNVLKGAAETRAMQKNIVLVTGGATRIGREMCRHYARNDYAVAIHYNQSNMQAEQLCAEIREQGGSAVCLQADLTDPHAPEQLIAEVIDRWGYIDVLINNAAVFYPTPLAELTPELWSEIFVVNLRVPHFLAKHAYPHLRKQQGAIVHIADIYAERPLPTHSAYCAAKAGLVALTKSLANELAPSVRVNAIEPGAILFPEGYTEAKQAELLAKIPLRRSGKEQDIAEAAWFLSDGASYVTGAVIPVDGGRLTTP